MYYSYGQRPSPSIDGWYTVWMIYDGNMITEDECGPNFLTFVLRLRENPGKNLNHKIDPTGIEPGTAAWEVTMLPLDHNGSRFRSGNLLIYPHKSWISNIFKKTLNTSQVKSFLPLPNTIVVHHQGGKAWLGFPDLWSGQKPWWNWYLTPVVNFVEVGRA